MTTEMTASTSLSSSSTDVACTEIPLYHEEWKPPFLPALILVPFLLPMFWEYSVTVTSTELVFGYSWEMTRVTIARVEITNAEVIQNINGLWHWRGWGIRLNLKGEIGYIGKNGPGVKVSTNKHAYVFNCNEPDMVCQILLNSSKE
jgi:hypothetical protein